MPGKEGADQEFGSPHPRKIQVRSHPSSPFIQKENPRCLLSHMNNRWWAFCLMFLHSTNIYRVPTSVNKLGPEDRYLLNKTDKVPALVELVA